MASTSTSNSNTMISRSKLLDLSDLNTYFTSSLFLLFGLHGGNDAIITDEGNNSIISKYLVIVYQRISRSNTVQLLFEFVTTIYLGINNIGDDASIELSPAAQILGFGYKQTSGTTTTCSNNVEDSNSSSSNVINKRRRRSRKLQIISYAFFRFVVPKLYEIMKRKGIDYINNKNNSNNKEEEEEEEDMSSSSLSLSLSASPTSSAPLTLQLSHRDHQKKKVDLKLTQISSNRKKLLLQRIMQFIDTTIPVVRFTLLLSCWKQNQNTTTNQHGGNVSMYLSGLSYTASPLPIASSYTSSLFVLYAHRRWFHREFVNLFWNRIGRSLITTSTEINDMVTQIYQTQKQYLLFLYKQKIVSRYYKNKNKNKIIKAKANINNNNYDDENKNENDDNANDCCQLCNTTNVIIPYRFIDCCQQIVCYICLWNYVIEYNTNCNNNNHNNNNNNSNNKNNNITKITIPCPVCYQDIQHCQPV